MLSIHFIKIAYHFTVFSILSVLSSVVSYELIQAYKLVFRQSLVSKTKTENYVVILFACLVFKPQECFKS